MPVTKDDISRLVSDCEALDVKSDSNILFALGSIKTALKTPEISRAKEIINRFVELVSRWNAAAKDNEAWFHFCNCFFSTKSRAWRCPPGNWIPRVQGAAQKLFYLKNRLLEFFKNRNTIILPLRAKGAMLGENWIDDAQKVSTNIDVPSVQTYMTREELKKYKWELLEREYNERYRQVTWEEFLETKGII